MNKRLVFILLLILFLNTFKSQGQLVLEGWTQSYLGVNSYDGAISNDGITIRFVYEGTNLYESNWRLTVKMIAPFQSGNALFPADKIKLIPSRTEWQSNHPSPLPTIGNIGVTSPATLSNITEVPLVPLSNAPLQQDGNSYYYDFKMIYSLLVEGGRYLKQLENNSFQGILRFTAYRQDNTIIDIEDMNFTIQVHKITGAPPKDDYSISFSTEASNAKIEHITLSDYIDGKSVTYRDGLTVSANTDFQLTVQSIEPHFSSVTGNSLPLDVVSLQLIGKSVITTPVVLSNNKRLVIQGKSTNGAPEKYDISYSTRGNDERLYNVPPDHYSTQLMYEITPK